MATEQLIFQPLKFDWHVEDQQPAFEEWKGQIVLALEASNMNRERWYATIVGFLGKERFKWWNNLPISKQEENNQRVTMPSNWSFILGSTPHRETCLSFLFCEPRCYSFRSSHSNDRLNILATRWHCMSGKTEDKSVLLKHSHFYVAKYFHPSPYISLQVDQLAYLTAVL